ncbi:MAG: elongation factor G [Ilumatobacter coccineus]|uniref:Elongation factor G n=1 Tax=Ilumatobacter coccineus TaxID=467094 RepID=A0A2G6KFL0_9ACTN|nr:MAG: elongation factor G [Ilumatobacter coccineus]
MPGFATEHIRNVALIGHGGVGKTTLAEALLHAAKVTTRAGTIDEGNTVLDQCPEEIERKSSVALGVASFDWTTIDGDTYRINLIDTPGNPDFEAEVDAALAVADLAVIVVSAPDGVEVGTELAWEKCEKLNLPRLVFITREGRPRANFERTLTDLRNQFGSGFTPIGLPIGEQEAFEGVADVITERAHRYGDDGSRTIGELPEDMVDRQRSVHEEVVEEIVSGDDEALERYLEGDVPSAQELLASLAAEVLACSEFPVLVGSGTLGIGVDRLAYYICNVGPSPADRTMTVMVDDEETEVAPDPSGTPTVAVFKTVADQYVGQVSIMKVVSGTVQADSTLTDVDTNDSIRMHGLFHLSGSTHTPTDKLIAGDIGGITKISSMTGATLAAKTNVKVVLPEPPMAHLTVALVPESQADDDKLGESLHRLIQEDPSYVLGHDELSRRTTLSVVGDAHLTVALARLRNRYGVHVTTDDVMVPYRRTVTGTVEAEGRVKKQSGGHGQFAVVNLRISPVPSGTGLDFVDAIVGGAIPKNYVAAVRNGVEEAMADGAGLKIPIVDVRVECYDGKTHSVDSSDMAFKTAAALGFADAVAAANPVILEPISQLTITVPTELQGDILGDLSSRRGQIVGSASGERGAQIITAEVPTAEIGRYAMDLRAMTGGRGRYDVEHSRYDRLPSNLAGAIVAAAKER